MAPKKEHILLGNFEARVDWIADDQKPLLTSGRAALRCRATARPGFQSHVAPAGAGYSSTASASSFCAAS